MSEHTDFSALEWVKGEINESLKQAQHALEAYVANPKDSTKMQFCITHLHQVWGTLRMVELEGATIFAEEMEALAQCLLDGKVPKLQEAQEVLMQAFLQLPTYLESMSSGSKDMPIVLLPVLNDLRSTRGAKLMSETALFTPDLDSGNKVAAQREESVVSDLEDQLGKLRQAYQKSLLSIIKGETPQKNLDYMGKVLLRLQKLSGKSQIGQLWWISGAMVDGLLNGSIELSKSVSSLLAAIDRQIKDMLDDHKKVLAAKIPGELAKNLLYYVATSDPTTTRISNVQKAYKLAKALPKEVREEQSQQARRGLVNEAIVVAVKVLIEDVLNIKESLDLVVRSKDGGIERIKVLLPVLKNAVGVLHLLSLTESRDVLAQQYKVLHGCASGKERDVKQSLMGVAGQLLAVEASLADIAKHGVTGKILIGDIAEGNKVSSDQLGVAQKALLQEAIKSLETVKELFGALLASAWDPAVLKEAAIVLKSVAGSVNIIPLPLVTKMLQRSAAYIDEKLVTSNAAPAQKELETFADVLSSVDYYLEKLFTDSRSDDSSLTIGCSRLAKLGYPVDDAQHLRAATPEAKKVENVETLESRPLVDETDDEADQKSGTRAEEKAVEQSKANDETTPVQVAPAENIIDDEIIEIFIEEVGEVLETLATYLPQWKVDTDNQSALAEVRRAFHTLKGSGRLVGAKELGETAWAIENMLNRVLDKTIGASEQVLQAVQAGVDVVPELLDLFKQGRNESTETSRALVVNAQALASGGQAIVAPAPLTKVGVEQVAVREEVPEKEAEAVTVEENEPEPLPEEYDQEIIEIFSQEAKGHLDNLNIFLDSTRGKSGPHIISDDVLRTLHTLKGCANMAAIQPVAPVVTKTENFVKELRLQDKKANDDVIALLENTVAFTGQIIAELPKVSKASQGVAKQLLEKIATLSDNLLHGTGTEEIDGDSGKHERIGRFLGFRFDTLFDIEDYLNDYFIEDVSSKQNNRESLNSVGNEISAIAALAKDCDLQEIADLSFAIATSLMQASQQTISKDFCADLIVAGARLIEIVDFLAAGQFIKSPAKITEKLNNHLSHLPTLAMVESVDDLAALPLAQVDEDETQDEAATTIEAISASDVVDVAEVVAVAQIPVPEVTEFENVASSIEQKIEQQENIETSAVAPGFVASEPVMDADIERDSEIVEIFLEEAQEIIERSANVLDQWQSSSRDLGLVAQLQRDLHTLKGGARMAEYASVGDLGHELENIYEGVCANTVEVSDELFRLLFRCHDRLSEMFNDIRSQGNCYRANDLIAEIKALVSGVPAVSGQSHQEKAHQEKAQQQAVVEQQTPAPVAIVDESFAFEATGAVEEISEPPISAKVIEPVAEEIIPQPVSKLLDEEESEEAESELDVDVELVEIFLEEAEEIIESSAAALEEWRNDLDNQSHVERLQRELHTLKGGARMAQIPEIGDFSHEMENLYEGIVNRTVVNSPQLINLLLLCHDRLNEMVTSLRAQGSCEPAQDLIEQVVLAMKGQFVKTEGVVKAAKSASTAKKIVLESNTPLDVIELFLADGVALVQQLEQHIGNLKNSANKKNISQAKEILSGLGGGAKLSGFKSLGDYCSYVDSLIDAQNGKAERYQELFSAFNEIKDFVVLLEKEKQTKTAKPAANTEVQKAAPKAAPKAPSKKDAPKDAAQQEKESIKIPAELLDTLVNLAGETSINRGRLEMQLSEFAFTIEEMNGTIERLQEQLRRLHLETEAQIVFRHESENKEVDEDFDPLEMDRYSAIDQLSRSLSESASDLMDLKDTLMEKNRDAETLLLQQGRINTELQEGLMRSRMVPFSRLLPRLRRIVRQVGNELKKPVDLEVLNAEGEMDRAVLERMISPIEHMLRNSIAHGIEKAPDRKAANKPVNGTISINLGREGSWMLITVKDDGAGVNVAAVRKKAIENGLLDKDADISDADVVEFIFNPGFSTATEVSQVSGRGVGMDVVASEIKQLGGNIETNSVTGSGTTFTIRLPFTVAVNRALMVTIGDAFYAIPLTSIEGVVRVSPYELEAYYEQENPVFRYAGVDYSLQYLGGYMYGKGRANLLGQTRPLPVLLVQSGEHSVAIQVDSLFGSREVVVKSVGPQLSTVAGISGATILGDGSVVIILDIHSMIRGAIAQKDSARIQSDVIEARKERRVLKVMVVDDSVTVRKVTSRLLERNGMEVLLAKDGVDAITQLQEVKPDVMLLDIEMPRMDGFEVATLVRHDARLQDLPIIMITSRTGEKHKERAMSIGVNRYLGKPFQESALLQTISELTSESVN